MCLGLSTKKKFEVCTVVLSLLTHLASLPNFISDLTWLPPAHSREQCTADPIFITQSSIVWVSSDLHSRRHSNRFHMHSLLFQHLDRDTLGGRRRKSCERNNNRWNKAEWGAAAKFQSKLHWIFSAFVLASSHLAHRDGNFVSAATKDSKSFPSQSEWNFFSRT